MHPLRPIAAVLALLLALPLFAEDLTRTDALVKLAEVWSAVRYQHPHLMLRDVDWDGALVRAVPKVREAKTHDELAAAIGAMLAELNDPATKVTKESKAEPSGADVPLYRRDGEVLVVNFGPYADAKGGNSLYRLDPALTAEMAKGGSMVFDLRTSSEDSADAIEYVFDNLQGLVIDPIPGIASRVVYHSGYAPQLGGTSGGYYSGFLTVASPPVEKGFSPVTTAPRIVLVTRGEGLPADAIALWLAGRAAIVSEVPIGDAAAGDERDQEPIDGMERRGEQADARIEQPPADQERQPDGQRREDHARQAQRDLIDAEQRHARGHRPQRAGRLVQPHVVRHPVAIVVRQRRIAIERRDQRMRDEVLGDQRMERFIPRMQRELRDRVSADQQRRKENAADTNTERELPARGRA